MIWHIGIILSGSYILAVIRASPQCEISTDSSPIVCIDDGCIRGKPAIGLGHDTYEAFQGIPFAKPPVGKLRFSDPTSNEPWTGEYDATWERSACIQKTDLRLAAVVTGSEDCLYLNVYRPQTNNGSLLAVMVYIHGGGYFSGSASSGVLGPEKFMETNRVILVTVQYRLGVFGYLSTGDHAASGNFGMKDQVLALKWVNNNIKHFGGDHQKVTIFGQSAGGASVQLHMMSPMSEGLFSRAVVMSGSALAGWSVPLEDPLQLARSQAIAVGIQSPEALSTVELVDELRRVDAVLLTKSIDKLKSWYRHPLVMFRPTVDGKFLSDDPRVLWTEDKYRQVPWMTGYVPNEGSVASLPIITNQTMLGELNRDIRMLLPYFIGGKSSTEAFDLIQDYYFPESKRENWITCSNPNNFSEVLGDAWIKYPIIQSVKQHLNKPGKSPLSMYFFNFKSQYSYSYHYSNTLADFGACHEDELLYLFRSPSLFPDFSVSSPEYFASRAWVEFYVNFAYGHTQSMCTEDKCEIFEISNSCDPSYSVKFDVRDGFDENLFDFWNHHYE